MLAATRLACSTQILRNSYKEPTSLRLGAGWPTHGTWNTTMLREFTAPNPTHTRRMFLKISTIVWSLTISCLVTPNLSRDTNGWVNVGSIEEPELYPCGRITHWFLQWISKWKSNRFGNHSLKTIHLARWEKAKCTEAITYVVDQVTQKANQATTENTNSSLLSVLENALIEAKEP